jgi:lipopolysaccharide biosynthesis regulator YciM
VGETPTLVGSFWAWGMRDASETRIIRTSILSFPMQLGKNGYISQIVMYLNNEDYEHAYDMSKEFIGNFPNELISRFLLAESAFWSGHFQEAAIEGHRAFNKASDNEDMLSCALVTASAYFELEEYAKGLDILKFMENRKSNEDLEKMMFVYSMAMHNPKEAAMHLNELYRINKAMAVNVVRRYFKD